MAQLLVRSKSWFASRALSTVPVEARVETMWTPGAVMSGWYIGSPGTPREEKSASQAGRFWPVWSAQWIAEFVGSGETSLHPAATPDRKSTRLNSSHGYISYAVFCLKKKKEDN